MLWATGDLLVSLYSFVSVFPLNFRSLTFRLLRVHKYPLSSNCCIEHTNKDTWQHVKYKLQKLQIYTILKRKRIKREQLVAFSMHSCLQNHHISLRNIGQLKTNDLVAMTDYVKLNTWPCGEQKISGKEEHQHNHWPLRNKERVVRLCCRKGLLFLLFWSLLIFIYSHVFWMSVKEKGMKGDACESACYVFITRPWKPSQRGASLLYFSWRACFISLSSFSTLTRKLINSCLLFPPLGCEQVRMELPPHLCTWCVGAVALNRLWPYLVHLRLWLWRWWGGVPFHTTPSDGTES